ncbi:MAG: hypothetical protein KJ063_12420 [Anaerolineae bacterium]|nr:hypothetical protein [Anaerolineae bacterium]
MPDYVDWFVNREKQYQGFQKMLAGETTRSIMLVEAPADMGKSWVVQRMRHLCEEQGVGSVLVNFRDRRAHDYLSLVRVARDQLGAESFNHLTQVINNFTNVNINLVGGGPSRGVNVGDVAAAQGDVNLTLQEVAGGNIIKDNVIRDNQFYIQADSEVARRAAEIQINDAFFSCLSDVLKKGPVVFLFDSYEDVTKEADQWIQEYLLARIADGLPGTILVIIAGRTAPELSSSLKQLIAKTGLTLFTEDHVKEYIQVKRKLTGLDLGTIFKTSGGYPGLLAKMADVAAMDDEEDEDWL